MRCAWLCALAACFAAQESRFDARSRLVLVPVTVTDGKGRPVDGLEVKDFQLFDNQKSQQAIVDTIDTGVAPIALVLAVQSSGISAAALQKVRGTAAMIQPLVTGDRGCAGVVSFDQRLTWLEECTGDEDVLVRALGKVKPLLRPGEDKEARLLDAVQSAVEHLSRRPNARRVLLLISETRDRGSESELAAATVAAQKAGVTIYAATYSAIGSAFTSKLPVAAPKRPLKPKMPNDGLGTEDGSAPTKGNPKHLPVEQQVDLLATIEEIRHMRQVNAVELLTSKTGGAMYPFAREKALEQAIRKLGTELHSQYVLSFVPEVSATPGYHTLEVKLAREGEFHLRARPGYWAAEEVK